MDFSNFLIIPDRSEIDEYIKLANAYNMSFEYNDFFWPKTLDQHDVVDEMIAFYKNLECLPEGNTLHGSFLDVTIFSRDDKVREVSEFRMRESMEIATKIGARAVIFHTNYIPNFIDNAYEDYWVESNERFIRTLLKEYPNLTIYMENMFDMEPTLLARLAKNLKDEERFGVCLDYAHVNVFGVSENEEWLDLLAPYVKHIHINDNDLIKDSHMALGEGKIDYKAFFTYYEKHFKGVSVLIEMKGIDKIKRTLDCIEKIYNEM